MTLCKNCNLEITDPSKPGQKFHDMKCFNEYRISHPKKKLPKVKPLVLNSHTLPASLENLTLGDILKIKIENIRLLDVEQKYLNLLEKIKDLIPREREKEKEDTGYNFLRENGSKMEDAGKYKNNTTIKADGIPNILKGRKPKTPKEELVMDNLKEEPEVKLEPAHKPILKMQDSDDDITMPKSFDCLD